MTIEDPYDEEHDHQWERRDRLHSMDEVHTSSLWSESTVQVGSEMVTKLCQGFHRVN